MHGHRGMGSGSRFVHGGASLEQRLEAGQAPGPAAAALEHPGVRQADLRRGDRRARVAADLAGLRHSAAHARRGRLRQGAREVKLGREGRWALLHAPAPLDDPTRRDRRERRDRRRVPHPCRAARVRRSRHRRGMGGRGVKALIERGSDRRGSRTACAGSAWRGSRASRSANGSCPAKELWPRSRATRTSRTMLLGLPSIYRPCYRTERMSRDPTAPKLVQLSRIGVT